MKTCAEPIVCATREYIDCEAHFVKHFARWPAGDYSALWPAKFSLDLLAESYQQDQQRFIFFKRKLEHRPVFKDQY